MENKDWLNRNVPGEGCYAEGSACTHGNRNCAVKLRKLNAEPSLGRFGLIEFQYSREDLL
jgi:hypothetical protein